MKNYKLTFLLALLMSMVGAKALAYDAKVNGIYYYFSGTNATVTYYSSTYDHNQSAYAGNVVIPETVTYNGTTYSVTSIASSAFRHCSGLTSVIIPNSVTSIGDYAFGDCSGLTSVTIGNSVTSLSSYAFYGCSGLTNISVASNNTKYDSRNNCNAIIESASNKLIVGCINTIIPSSVTSIGEYAFHNCSALTSVTIPSSVTSIGSWAFSYCSALTSVNIPSSVTSIGNSAFYGCSGLKSVTIPDSVTSIGNSAFYGCSGLTGVTIPNSVTSLGSYAFYGCSGLQSVMVGNGVTNIPEYAFGTGTNIKSFTVGAGVLSISSYAFYNSGTKRPIKTIWLTNTPPSGYTYAAGTINYVPNDQYSSLNNKTVYNSHFEVDGMDYVSVSTSDCMVIDCDKTGVINLPESVVYNGKTYSVTSIGSYAFNGCSSLTSVTIPNSVTSLGSYAFYGCSGLQSVVVGNGVTSIPSGAFGTGTKIKSFTVGAGVLSINSDAFYNGSSTYKPIKTIWLTNTPPSDYSNAAGTINYVANNLYTNLSNTTEYKFLSSLFEVDGVKYVPVSPSERTCDAIDCLYSEGAENIHIGKTVTNKGITLTVKQVHPYAFYGNCYVKDVDLTFDGNVGNYAFYGCSNIENAAVKNTGNVGDYAFSSITGTGTLTADINNAGTIGTRAFDGSTRLTTLQIGNKVTNVGGYAYYGCTGLTTATVNNKGSLGNYVFQGCTAMTTATLGEEITSVGQYAFSGCSSLQGIVIPNAVKTIGQYGFQNCSAMTSVQMGTGVTSIATYTFAGCSALTNMQIGSNVTTINTYAFSGCTSLPEIRIPRAVTTISNYVFSGCSGLKNVIMEDRETVLNLGYGSYNSNKTLFSDCPLDSVYIGGDISYNTSKSYGYSPFYRNTTLRSVVITDKETEISENEFYGCTSLKNISIGDGVESIGNWAFSGCASLDYFAFGTALKTIGKESFSDCTAVTQIISRAATPPTCGSQALDDISKWTCTLIVPPGGVSAYQAADQWKEFWYIQEEKTDNLWFKLTYMVDGEEYKSYNKLYGTAITPEAAPEKEGYTFSGWSPIPETMPARDVIIVGTFTKDPEVQPYEPDLSQTDNVIYVNSAEARVGSELTLAIKMKNNVGIRGFQFDLYLPDGVTPVKTGTGKIKASLTAARLPEDDAHTLTVDEQQDGAIRFLCGSQYDETFTGTDGEIATITLNIAQDMEAGTYPMVLRNIKLTETNINKYYVADGITAMLTVLSYVTGDISGDNIVDVSDYIGIANHIMGSTPEGFNKKAADVNNDNAIDVSDYIGVANIIMTGSVYGHNANASRTTTRRANTDVSAIDNVIYIEPFQTAAGTQQQLSLKMKNTVAIRGFQFDLYLPDGITAAKTSAGRIKAGLTAARLPEDDAHTLTVDEQQDGAIRFLCGSQYDETFTGTDGEIATLTVNVAADMVAGDYPITLKYVKLTETNINNYYLTDEVETTVTVTAAAAYDVVLDEDDTSAPADAENVDVLVRRTINANEWSTIVLPFSMTPEQVTAAFGSGVKIGDFMGCTEKDGNIVLNFDEVTTIDANHPYVIKVKEPVAEFTVDGVNISAEDEPAVSRDKKGRYYNSFIGTYVAETPVPDYCLFLSDNELWFSTGKTKMKAFRAYFDLATAGAEYSRFTLSFGDEPTGVQGVAERRQQADQLFDLQGRRVEHPAHGVYVRNGKKVVIK